MNLIVHTDAASDDAVAPLPATRDGDAEQRDARELQKHLP